MSKAPVSLKFTNAADSLEQASEDVLIPLSDATNESEPLDVYRDQYDAHIDKAKQLVVDNYNAHRDRRKTPAITTQQVHIVWFVKALANWKAIVVSPIIRGLLYEVTYDGRRNESYINIFKKINDVKIAD